LIGVFPGWSTSGEVLVFGEAFLERNFWSIFALRAAWRRASVEFWNRILY
jgi:hypothetical protein